MREIRTTDETAVTLKSSAERWSSFGKWGGVLLFLLVLFLPRPAGMTPAAQRMAAVTVLMAVWWLAQALPLAATSLVPLVAFPLLGIQPAREVSKAYIDHNVFLFLGGFIVALGIEKWGLHRRMALHIVRLLGTGLKQVVLGFMAATAFLSMWISNTASTLLMLPIGLAMIASLREFAGGETVSELRPESGSPLSNGAHGEQLQQRADHFAAVLMIGIAYAASIGGFTTLVGTPTNVTFLGIWSEQFPARRYPQVPEISAGEWMLAVFPVGLLLLLCAWGVLTRGLPSRLGTVPLSRRFFSERLRALGPPTTAERRMLAVFVITAALWIFRKPLTLGGVQLLPGWGDLWTGLLSADGAVGRLFGGWDIESRGIHDSTVALGMALLMFLIPAHRKEERNPAEVRTGRTDYLMDWKTAEDLPWGILLLIGGGFAIAGGFQSTQLADWIGGRFAEAVSGWPVWLLVAGICLLLTFLTELTSNVATVSTLMPILAGTALRLEVDPRLLMIPAVLSASCAFMLPIATPPNAIVFGSGRIRMGQMAAYGLVLNVIGVVVISVSTLFLLAPQLGIVLHGLPDWLQPPR